MTIFGDGFLPYHIEVEAEPNMAASIKDHLQSWKSRLRDRGTYVGFSQTLERDLQNIPGVKHVVLEGPQSALLIPLRMAQGITEEPCTMSAVLGTGLIADAIEAKLQEWNIELAIAKRIPEDDSPLEFSIREPNGVHESIRLYPVSRKRLRSTLPEIAPLPNHLVLNRYNKGLLALARSVSEQGGTVSLRIREFGKFDRVDEYLQLLPFTRQLILSTRHAVLAALARHAQLKPLRSWPQTIHDLHDETGMQLVDWLLNSMPEGGIAIFTLYKKHSTIFFSQKHGPVILEAPQNMDSSSRAARLQGALLSKSILLNKQGKKIANQRDWQTFCEWVMNKAFEGTDQRPWLYPNTTKL